MIQQDVASASSAGSAAPNQSAFGDGSSPGFAGGSSQQSGAGNGNASKGAPKDDDDIIDVECSAA